MLYFPLYALTNLLTYFRGFFETAQGSCEACDSSCLTCDGIKSQCLSCADGHYLESGMCRLNCSLRTYPADDGTCRRCPLHCDVCSDDRTCFSEFLALLVSFYRKLYTIVLCPEISCYNFNTHPPCHFRMQFSLSDAERSV